MRSFTVRLNVITHIRMKRIAWLLVLLIWLLPFGAFYTCPYDLHGTSSCFWIGRIGNSASLILLIPGFVIATWIDGVIGDPYDGVNLVTTIVCVVGWLVALSLAILAIATRLSRRTMVRHNER